MPPSDKDQAGSSPVNRLEMFFLAILLLTTLLSAFCAYQANNWNGIQSAKYQEAASLRTESVRAYNDGNTQLLIDLDVFLTWAEAIDRNETIRANAVASRFTPSLKPAFTAWISQDPGHITGTIPNGTPFSLPEYHLSAREKGDQLEKNATAAFVEAQYANDISSSYILNTLLFGIVLFLCGVGERWEDPRLRKLILVAAIIFFSIAVIMLLGLPKNF